MNVTKILGFVSEDKNLIVTLSSSSLAIESIMLWSSSCTNYSILEYCWCPMSNAQNCLQALDIILQIQAITQASHV